MTPRNYSLWRTNIRRHFERLPSSRRNRGAWSNPNADYALTSTQQNGSWRHFSPAASVALTIAETYQETQANTTTYNDGTPTGGLAQTWTNLREVTALVPRAAINPAELDPSATSAYYAHTSPSPYGEGLYNCYGHWIIYAPTRLAGNYTVNASILPDYSTDLTTVVPYEFSYSTLGLKIQGLSTPVRWVSAQSYHPPVKAYRYEVTLVTDLPGGYDDEFILTEIPFTPPETDPDGQPGWELYWTDQALRTMIDGRWDDDIDLTSGSISRTVPDFDDTNNIVSDAWTHHWTRAGHFSLKFSHSPIPS